MPIFWIGVILLILFLASVLRRIAISNEDMARELADIVASQSITKLMQDANERHQNEPERPAGSDDDPENLENH